MFKIEKNVPMPNNDYPFSQMQVGDSFLIGGSGMTRQKRYNVQVNVLTAARAFKKNGHTSWEFASRSVRGGLRVWRTK